MIMPEPKTDSNANGKSQSISSVTWAVILLVLFGFLLRLLAVTQRESIGVDSVRYLTFARNYIHGIYFTQGPTGLRELPDIGYPVIMAIFMKAFRLNVETSAVAVSLIAGTITLILVYFLALRASGRKTALFALFLAAVCQPLIEYSSLVQTESLFIMLMAVAAYMSYATTRRGYNTFWFMIGGITSAYAYLTRGIGISFFLIFPLTTFLVARCDGAINHPKVKSRFGIGIAMFLIGFILIALPYMIMLYRTYDRFTLSDQSIWHSPRVWHPEVNFSADPRYDGTLKSNGSDYLINDEEFFKFKPVSDFTKLKSFVRNYLGNQVGIYYYHLRELFPPLILILIGLGLFALPWDSQFRKTALLMGMWSVPFLILQPLYYTEARYIAPIAIFLIIFAGRGAVALIEWFKNTFPKTNPLKIEWIIAVALFVLMTPSMVYPLTHKGPKYSYPDLRDAGNFLAGYARNEESFGIMDYFPISGYYAHADRNLVIPDADLEGVIWFAHTRDVKYIILAERKIPLARPRLKELLYTSEIPYNLDLIYDNNDQSGYKVRIFKIKDLTAEKEWLRRIHRDTSPPPPFYKREVDK
jgi:4-amino-4-deoxy-L-arabinose transferase-like glycosyltransferase